MLIASRFLAIFGVLAHMRHYEACIINLRAATCRQIMQICRVGSAEYQLGIEERIQMWVIDASITSTRRRRRQLGYGIYERQLTTRISHHAHVIFWSKALGNNASTT